MVGFMANEIIQAVRMKPYIVYPTLDFLHEVELVETTHFKLHKHGLPDLSMPFTDERARQDYGFDILKFYRAIGSTVGSLIIFEQTDIDDLDFSQN